MGSNIINAGKSGVKEKVTILALLCISIFSVCFLVCSFILKEKERKIRDESDYGYEIVRLNEIDYLLDEQGDYEKLKNNAARCKELIKLYEDELRNKSEGKIQSFEGILLVLYICGVGCIVITFVVIYIIILRPFHRLENFAGEIAIGNLDEKLEYERVNMFGEFTWAFDHMRKEIKRARQCEQAAIENNKTVIATLSHDIKTPVASIRAYAEGLQENMDNTAARRNKYIGVIIRKCDEVTKITNDMFIHSLHELDKLVIKKEKVNIDRVIKETVLAMSGDNSNIIIKNDLDVACLENVDGSRIEQVIENIIGNAKKYAPCSDINIWTKCESRKYEIHIRDFGNGIPAEDMPFVFDKFYRGKNRGENQGAGLGLFIVKYMMEQMNGEVILENHPDGLEVILTFFNS